MSTVRIVLPYPISANRYWVPMVVKVPGTSKTRTMFVLSKEAREYKATVAALAWKAGVRQPMVGRVRIEYWLYPERPQDWAKRAAKHPTSWDDTVRCIDLDNAQKVLMDSLKGQVIEDDKWVFEISARRCEPDGHARLELVVTPLQLASPQTALFEAISA